LPYFRTGDMIFRMKTTLVIDDGLMRRLKARAARLGTTLSAVVEEYLQRGLSDDEKAAKKPRKPFRFPSYDMGRLLVDITDREALDRIFDEERGLRPPKRARR
jgi:hypothetical protein